MAFKSSNYFRSWRKVSCLLLVFVVSVDDRVNNVFYICNYYARLTTHCCLEIC
jgi:hypothetical protein